MTSCSCCSQGGPLISGRPLLDVSSRKIPMRMSVSRSVPGTRCGTNGRADPSARSRSIRSDAASRDFRSRALQTAASRARRSTIPLRTGAVASGEWLDYLKFDGSTPDFDVVAKTIEYTSTPGYRAFQLREIPSEYYAEEYVFRGPVVGPINRKDLVETNACFGLDKSFPDLDRQTFGFCVDPDNPYRCLFFERWTATHTGDLSIPGVPGTLPATGRKANIPAFPFSVVWNPDGKIIYEHLTTAVDRFEGNTRGKVAVFGLFETAGVPLDNSVGNQALAFAQKVNRWLDGPAQIYSKQENIPKWWKSKAVGAEPNDL